MKVVVGGGSGYVGQALVRSLAGDGHEVVVLSRAAGARQRAAWDDAAAQVDGADAVVNLAGTSIGGPRWTRKRKESILSSRVETTRVARRRDRGGRQQARRARDRLGDRLLRRRRRCGARRGLAAGRLLSSPGLRGLGGRSRRGPGAPRRRAHRARRRPGGAGDPDDGPAVPALRRRADRRWAAVVSVGRARRPRSRLPARARRRHAQRPGERRRARAAPAARRREGDRSGASPPVRRCRSRPRPSGSRSASRPTCSSRASVPSRASSASSSSATAGSARRSKTRSTSALSRGKSLHRSNERPEVGQRY